MRRLLFLAGLIAPVLSGAPPVVAIDQTSFRLPKIAGLLETSNAASPAFRQTDTFTAGTNRLLACYTMPSFPWGAGRERIDRYCLLQTFRAAETMVFSEQDFQGIREGFKDSFEKMARIEGQKALDAIVSQANGTRGAESAMSLPSIKVGELTVLRTLADNPRTYQVLVLTKYTASKGGASEETPVVMTIALLRSKGKVLYFYTYSKFAGKDDVDWVCKISTQWLKDFQGMN